MRIKKILTVSLVTLGLVMFTNVSNANAVSNSIGYGSAGGTYAPAYNNENEKKFNGSGYGSASINKSKATPETHNSGKKPKNPRVQRHHYQNHQNVHKRQNHQHSKKPVSHQPRHHRCKARSTKKRSNEIHQLDEHYGLMILVVVNLAIVYWVVKAIINKWR